MLSKSAVRKAGSVLRRQVEGVTPQAEIEQALAVVSAYRASFASPLEATSNELTTLLETYHIQGEVSQRLKRMSTILEKITSRESKLDLSRMQDIGGCRIVLTSNDIGELRRLETHVRERWAESVKRASDYVGRPRVSGYRAVHIVIEQDQRLIEIQLRTQRMHQWAQRVEGLSAAFGINYKQDGSSPVQEYAMLTAKMYVALDEGEAPDVEDMRRLNSLSALIAGELANLDLNPDSAS
ncbi:hypothetical protein E4J66_04285 [Actinomyces viscosus]|uniref:Bifunctional (P)ppGpp synthase/hydrolase RelA n=1 Tax=Actinomyces viscosus TaxID=1656 RepID=A0A448PNY5_ACTVI|nr:RelA/SpoT domain-containing protein [Actinomyces viscosus]TFH53328.1 hypothetical protein E4J66_04285 [Actinomyces viscosus]VEI18001.1 Bifunctional (p)ppGpp synthase/hydrolase RelA [Actinomyces viscosus]